MGNNHGTDASLPIFHEIIIAISKHFSLLQAVSFPAALFISACYSNTDSDDDNHDKNQSDMPREITIKS